MSTSHAPVLHRSNPAPLSRRLTALASAFALVALLSGNAAAYPLDRDDGVSVSAPSSPCHLAAEVVLDRHLAAKLRTTAGCAVIAYL